MLLGTKFFLLLLSRAHMDSRLHYKSTSNKRVARRSLRHGSSFFKGKIARTVGHARYSTGTVCMRHADTYVYSTTQRWVFTCAPARCA